MSQQTGKPQAKEGRVFSNKREEDAYYEMIALMTGRTYPIPRKLEKRWRGQRGGHVFKRLRPLVPSHIMSR